MVQRISLIYVEELVETEWFRKKGKKKRFNELLLGYNPKRKVHRSQSHEEVCKDHAAKYLALESLKRALYWKLRCELDNIAKGHCMDLLSAMDTAQYSQNYFKSLKITSKISLCQVQECLATLINYIIQSDVMKMNSITRRQILECSSSSSVPKSIFVGDIQVPLLNSTLSSSSSLRISQSTIDFSKHPASIHCDPLARFIIVGDVKVKNISVKRSRTSCKRKTFSKM